MMKKMIITMLLLQLPCTLLAKEYPAPPAQDTALAYIDGAEESNFDTFQIPFKRYSSQLGTKGKNAIAEILPRLRGAHKIIVQGRPDHPVSSKPSQKAFNISSQRANTLKQMLVTSGVAESKIFIETLNEPSYTDTPEVYNATIKVVAHKPETDSNAISGEAVVPITSASKFSALNNKQSISANSVRRVLKTAIDNNLSATDTGRLFESWLVVESPGANHKNVNRNELLIPLTSVRRVLKTAIENNLTAMDASRMFESWIAVEHATVPVEPTSLATEPATQRDDAYKSGTVITQSAPRLWRLEPTKSLRDNMQDWAKQAGWNQPQWAASQQYKVMSAATFDGEYPEVLRKISDQSKLNVCVRKSDRVVKITDSNTSCKE